MSSLLKKAAVKERSKRVFSLVRKELDSLRKDKISMAILFLIPIVMIITVGSAKVNFAAGETNIWIIDYDDSPKSHEFIETFRNSSDTMKLVTNHEDPTVTEEQAKKDIVKVSLDAYIIIPKGFEADLIANRTTDLEVHIDAIDFIQKASVQATILLGVTDYQLVNLQFERDVFYFPVLEPEESLNLLQLAAPLMIGIILFATLNLAASQSIVGDIPLKRMLTTPTFRFEVLIAKTIAYSIVSIFQIIICLVLLRYVYDVMILSTLFELFLLLFLVSLSGILLGIFFSSIATSRLQASQLFLFIFIMQLLISMQVRIDGVLRWLPLEQGKLGFAGLALRGLSILDPQILYGPILNLVLFSTVIFVANLIYFQFVKKEFV